MKTKNDTFTTFKVKTVIEFSKHDDVYASPVAKVIDHKGRVMEIKCFYLNNSINELLFALVIKTEKVLIKKGNQEEIIENPYFDKGE